MPSQNDQTTPRIPTGERAAQKRRAILAAARTVFMRDGFGVGLDVIAAEADVSKVTIYNHFGSKDQLFAEVIGSSLEDALTAAITGAESRLSASDDLREAAVLEDGERLGPVGSLIVGEVLLAVIDGDPGSQRSADPDWRPTLPARQPGRFTLTDLLAPS